MRITKTIAKEIIVSSGVRYILESGFPVTVPGDIVVTEGFVWDGKKHKLSQYVTLLKKQLHAVFHSLIEKATTTGHSHVRMFDGREIKCLKTKTGHKFFAERRSLSTPTE